MALQEYTHPKLSVANSMILYCFILLPHIVFNLQVEVKQLTPQNLPDQDRTPQKEVLTHIGAILIAGMWLG